MVMVVGSCFAHFGGGIPGFLAVWGCSALGILQALFSRLFLNASFSAVRLFLDLQVTCRAQECPQCAPT